MSLTTSTLVPITESGKSYISNSYYYTTRNESLSLRINKNHTISDEEYEENNNISSSLTCSLAPEDAYNMARDLKIVVEHDIYDENNEILLSQYDLIYVSQYNPPVNYNEYLKIMKYSKNKILYLYPELSFIKINIIDMKYYAMANSSSRSTRFEITPNLSKYSYYLERGRLYYHLGDIAKTLLLKIYGNIDTYMKCITPSPLEDLIIRIDKNIEKVSILLSLADRYGLSLSNYDVISNENYNESIRDHIYLLLDGIIQKLYHKNYNPLVSASNPKVLDIQRPTLDTHNKIYNPNIILKMSNDTIESYSLEYIINMTYLEYLVIFPNALIESYSERLVDAVLN